VGTLAVLGSAGAIVGAVWLAHGASPGIPARIARVMVK
jgi:hypothetical protein